MGVKGLGYTPRRSWLKHCAASQKFAGCISDGHILIFKWLNPSGPPYGPAIDSASSRSKYQVYILGIKAGRWVRLTNLLTSCADFIEILGASTSYRFT